MSVYYFLNKAAQLDNTKHLVEFVVVPFLFSLSLLLVFIQAVASSL